MTPLYKELSVFNTLIQRVFRDLIQRTQFDGLIEVNVEGGLYKWSKKEGCLMKSICLLSKDLAAGGRGP